MNLDNPIERCHCIEFRPDLCGCCKTYGELKSKARAYESIKDSLNMGLEGASPDEVEAEIKKILDYSTRFRLDQAGIENREAEAEELVYLRAELQRIQKLPYMSKARASAVIMQVAAQLARMSETQKAKQLQEAVDLWATYTGRVEADRDRLKEELEVAKSKIAHRDMKVKLLENKL